MDITRDRWISEWKPALEQTARRLPPGDPFALVFVEERHGIRVESTGGAGPRITLTRTRGASVRLGARHAFRSDPWPEDLEPLLDAALRGDPIRPVPRESAQDGEEQDDWVGTDGRLRRAASLANCGSSPEGDSLWVSFNQRIGLGLAGKAPIFDTRQSERIRFWVYSVKGDRSTGVSCDLVGPGISDKRIDRMKEYALERAMHRLGAMPVVHGTQAVVFHQGTGGIVLHELIGHALEADSLHSGRSWLTRVHGEITGPDVFVVDDPSRGRGAWSVDDEGVAPKEVHLLERGVVTGHLCDRRTAAELGGSSTGHGRRSSFAEPVRPRMGCTFLLPGRASADDVVSSTPSGIFVRRIESAGTDAATGVSFFRVSDADRIVRGRIEAPLHPFLLQMTAADAMRSLDAIADDLAFDTCVGTCVRDGQAMATSVGAPTCRIGLAIAFFREVEGRQGR